MLCVSFGGFFANFTVFLMRSVQVPQLSPRGCGPVLDKVVDVPIVVQCVDMMVDVPVVQCSCCRRYSAAVHCSGQGC